MDTSIVMGEGWDDPLRDLPIGRCLTCAACAIVVGMSDEQPWSSNGFYDDKFADDERLPRQFSVRVEELNTEPSSVVLFDGWRSIGNELTDNSRNDDGYRFHDVFHLSYATHLRWSPVIRKLFGRKRRSSAEYDEVEDGGRATVIEEGIAHLVFSYARTAGFFEGAQSVDAQLIGSILNQVSSLEVASASASQWEIAILEGFRVWRQVRAQRGGLVSGDLYARTLRFESIGTSVFTDHPDASEMGATHWALAPTWEPNDLNLAVLFRREPPRPCAYCGKRRIVWQPINQEGGGDAVCTPCQSEAGWPKPTPLPCPYPTHVGPPSKEGKREYLWDRRGRSRVGNLGLATSDKDLVLRTADNDLPTSNHVTQPPRGD